MTFQIKDFVSIVAAQINHARGVTTKITDYQPGSVARTLMEAPAVEIEELYLQMFLGLRDAIPVATFLSFGFERLPAATAIGYVSISKNPAPTSSISIPKGTTFSSTDGRVYTSIADVIWVSGQSVISVQVAASSAGSSGNVAQGVINSCSLFNSDYIVSNSTIDSGRDIETDSEREARFAEFVGALSRGTVFASLYGAAQAKILDVDGNIFEYVTKRGIREQPGHVVIYLYSNRGIPSAELIAIGQKIIDGSRDETTGVVTPGYRAGGVSTDVLPMTERSVPLSIQVGMLDGYTLNTAVNQQLGDIYGTAIRAVEPGTTLYLGALVDKLLAADGVRTIVPVTNSNIVCGVNEVLMPGTLTTSAL